MRTTASLALLLVSAAWAWPQTSLAIGPTDDLARLQGRWTTQGGLNKDLSYTQTITGNVIEIVSGKPLGRVTRIKGILKLDEKASPKSFDLTELKNEAGEAIADIPAIYKFEDDNLVVCSGGPGGVRPGRFEAGEKRVPTLSTWTRVRD